MFKWTLWLLAAAALAGCAATRFEDGPLSAGMTNEERRVVDQSGADRPLILVAVSGGGSRAAALGWAVLKELRHFSYPANGQSRRLIDDIGVISSVSGGSVIAAQFALRGPDGLDAFEPAFLGPDNMRTLAIDAANPISWLKLALTGSSRIDTVESLFDRELFEGKTFTALNQPGRPYLILNATEMASGEVFAFTPRRFDDICADLDSEPISVGVAASSAVPIVLTPIALKDFSETNCRDTPAPRWIRDELGAPYAPYVNLENFKLAQYANELRHGKDSVRPVKYLYLLDGGLADNLAIHGLLESISSPYAAPIVHEGEPPGPADRTILQAIDDGGIQKIAVLVINARADPASGIDQSPSRPGILKMIGAVTSVPIDSTTTSVNAQLELLLSDLNAAGAGGAGDPQFKGLRVYGIQVDFDLLPATDPGQRELRAKAKAIPTLWTISKDNLDVIEQAAKTLLDGQPCFQRLLLDEHIEAEFIDAKFAVKGCPQASAQ